MAPHPAGSHLLAREIHGEGALQKVRIAADGMGGVAVVAAAVEEWSNNVWHNVSVVGYHVSSNNRNGE